MNDGSAEQPSMKHALDDVGARWGANIARARNARGLTQDNLAATLGVTQVTVSRWETGTGTSELGYAKQRRIAAALGQTMAQLFPRDCEADLVTDGDGLAS